MTEAASMFSDGKAYERMMGRWSRVAGTTFLDWLDPPKGQRWLDAGCGNGAFTEEIVARSAPAAVSAVDPSEGQIAYALTRPAAQHAQFEIGDAQNLDFADNNFDVATMALVIAFLPDPARAAAELARVVRPGGSVATYMWDVEAGGTPISPVGSALKSLGITPGQPPNPPASGRDAMQAFWDNAGLVDVETRVIRIPVVYSSLDDFWDSNIVPIGPMGALLGKMTSGEREQLRARLREQLPIAADGSISYDAVANAVKGRVKS